MTPMALLIHPVLLSIGSDVEWFDRRYGYWIVLLFLFISVPLVVSGGSRIDNSGRHDWRGWRLLAAGSAFWICALISGLIGRLPWDWWNNNNQEKTYHNTQLHTPIIGRVGCQPMPILGFARGVHREEIAKAEVA